MTENLDNRRLDLVRAAQQQWIAALTDLGGRNTLLYYKDRRASTLDLAQADPQAVDRLEPGRYLQLGPQRRHVAGVRAGDHVL